MSPEAQKIRDLFVAAVKLPPDRWPAFLEEASAGDAEACRQVSELLQEHQQVGSFLDRPVARVGGTGDFAPAANGASAAPAQEGPGTAVGPYKLLELIGEGGMGAVWMAQQTEPVKRLVAVKLIKGGTASKQVLARFEAERQALALMEHAHIARVLDAGTTGAGRPYFVMELVKGVPITRYCDEHQLTPRQRLELFLPVCQAVQHAHQKGVIHRDLKPSNVLVALYDGKPVPKVIDFGVAKAVGQPLTDKTLVTGFGAIVGTLEYMSPEQAEINQLDVDTRSDIYSLGVLLYELLAGSPPFTRQELTQAGLLEMLRVIREQEPSKPSTKLSTSESIAAIAARRHTEPAKLSKLVRGDLDWITLKCLEKDRTRRYDTATSLARDIQRYLNDEPVEASPPSPVYRLRKFLRRNKASAMAASLALLVLGAGITGTTWGLSRADRNWRKAETSLAAETEARQGERQARDRAMAALRSMTDEIVQNQMARETQLRDEDRQFLRTIIQHYEGLAAITSNDVESRAIRAEGHAQVGMIRHRLGELAEAEAALAEAVRLSKQLLAESPDRPRSRQELARSLSSLSTLLRATGRLNEAEASETEALALYTQLAADFPDSPELRQALAQTYGNLGNLLSDVGRLNEAEAAYTEAVARQKRLAADFPGRPNFRGYLATSHSNLGILLRATGRWKEAEASFADAVAIQKQLAADFPTRPDYRQDLAVSHINLGVLLRDAGRRKEEEVAYAEARSLYQGLAADFPAVPEFRHRLALSSNSLAELFLAAGRPRDAEAVCSDALAIQRKLVADFPTHTDFRLQLARIYKTQGSVLENAGRFAEAEAAFASKVALTRQLTADHPTAPRFRKELASSHNDLGVFFRARGRLAEAQAAYADAAAIKKQLVADFPDEPDLRHSLAGTLGNLAIVCTQRGDFPAAKAYLDEALPHHRAALTANPGHPDYRKFYRVNLRALTAANARVNDQAGAALVAETCRAIGWDPAIDTYNAARNLAQCIPIVQEHEQLDSAQRQAALQFYTGQAMALLRDAVAKGWTNIAQMKKDNDLDALRPREDFQQLLSELDRK